MSGKKLVVALCFLFFVCSALLYSFFFKVSRNVVNVGALAPFCVEFHDNYTVHMWAGTTFEHALVTMLHRWGALNGWKVQYTIDIDSDTRTRPDLCFGADPEQMLDSGWIIVADVKLSRTPNRCYPDTYVVRNNYYRKYRYHYAAKIIEEDNRKRIIRGFNAFCEWLTNDNARIAYNSKELKDWSKVWSVIAKRVNQGRQDNASADERFFASCFGEFYDKLNFVLEDRGQMLVEVVGGVVMPSGKLFNLLKKAFESYTISKEIRILHPYVHTVARPEDYLFDAVPSMDRRAFEQMNLRYINVFAQWWHLFSAETAQDALLTLQFIIGMYMGLWDFDGNPGREKDIASVRLDESMEEDGGQKFPVFSFAVNEKIDRIAQWMKDSVFVDIDPGHKNRRPYVANVVDFGSNPCISYFRDADAYDLAFETFVMFLLRYRRLKKAGVVLREADISNVLDSIVRHLNLRQLPVSQRQYFFDIFKVVLEKDWNSYSRRPASDVVDLLKSEMLKKDNHEETKQKSEAKRLHQVGSIKKLINEAGFLLLSDEEESDRLEGRIDFLAAPRRKKRIESFCNYFSGQFESGWQREVLGDFINDYLRPDDGLVFSGTAQVRRFLFRLDYMRNIVSAETKASREEQIAMDAPTSHCSVHDIKVDYKTGRVTGPLSFNKYSSQVKTFSSVKKCAGAYAAIVSGMEKEYAQLKPLYEALCAWRKVGTKQKRPLVSLMVRIIAAKKNGRSDENLQIRNLAAQINRAGNENAFLPDDIGVEVDTLLNLIKKRLKAVKAMRYSFKERYSIVCSCALVRLYGVFDIAECLDSENPLAKLDRFITYVSFQASFPPDLLCCVRDVRKNVAKSGSPDLGFCILQNYLNQTELNAMKKYIYKYKEHEGDIKYIKERAELAHCLPAMDIAA